MTGEVKRVYAFGKDAHGNNVTEGNTNMKAILGGKGANLAEMANIGLPVPPGFTISCQTCMEYATADNTWPEGALDTIHEYRVDLEERMGKKIGDAQDPLLVSVRSGAPMSMPGMMDTVLNLGLNDQSINGLIAQTENPRFAWDSYRRFIQMFSNVVMGLDGDLFENAITAMKNDRGVASDTDLSAEDLQELVADFKRIFAENVSADEYPNLVVDGAVQFPQDPMAPRSGHRGRVRQLEQPARGPLPQAEQDRRRPGHGRQRACPWCSGTRATPRPRAWPSRATPPTARRSSTATTW